jgi:spermidine synthase
MRMRNAFGLIAASMAMSATTPTYGGQPDSFVIETSRKRKSPKSKLTKKQQKVRAKNKASKQSRKKNRK